MTNEERAKWKELEKLIIEVGLLDPDRPGKKLEYRPVNKKSPKTN